MLLLYLSLLTYRSCDSYKWRDSCGLNHRKKLWHVSFSSGDKRQPNRLHWKTTVILVLFHISFMYDWYDLSNALDFLWFIFNVEWLVWVFYYKVNGPSCSKVTKETKLANMLKCKPKTLCKPCHMHVHWCRHDQLNWPRQYSHVRITIRLLVIRHSYNHPINSAFVLTIRLIGHLHTLLTIRVISCTRN